MTNPDQLPGDRLPDEAPWLIPTEAQCGHGYIAETGEDAIVVTAICEKVGPVNIGMPPELAIQLAAMLATQCVKLRRLQINGDTKYPVVD